MAGHIPRFKRELGAESMAASSRTGPPGISYACSYGKRFLRNAARRPAAILRAPQPPAHSSS